MSELEEKELRTRINGMSTEEKRIAASVLPDDILWEELQHRYMMQNAMVKIVKETVKKYERA